MIKNIGFILVAGAVALFVFCAQDSSAAPAMAHDTCVVTGTLESVEKIKITRPNDDSWLKSWGLSKNYSETSIKITPHAIEVLHDINMDKTSCTLEKAAEGYYLKHRSTLKLIPEDYQEGDCITAKTNFSGDEFRIGNWIYDIEVKPSDFCNTEAVNKKNNHTTKED
jgi:hypothetical protein